MNNSDSFKPEDHSLKKTWPGLGSDSIEDQEAEIQSVRRELQEALLNRTFGDAAQRRIPGVDVGLFTVLDDVGDPLPEEILQSFDV